MNRLVTSAPLPKQKMRSMPAPSRVGPRVPVSNRTVRPLKTGSLQRSPVKVNKLKSR